MNSLSDPGLKILQYPDRLADFKRDLAYPISAEVDLTWRCSLNCFGCHSKWLHSGIELSEDGIKRILTQLHDKGLKSVTWSGGGDPLESPHWRYAVELACDMRLDQGLFSYLPGLDQEMADYIGSRFDFVVTHSCSTRKLKRPQTKTVWSYSYLLDESNWHNCEEMFLKADKEFFNFIYFRPLGPENKPDADLPNYSWVDDSLAMLQRLKPGRPQLKFSEYKFLDLLKPDYGRDYKCCFSTDFTCHVGPSGEMSECLNRRGFSDSILGNLLTEDLGTIWKRKARFREDMTDCRILCRNHELNKTLYHKVFGPVPDPDHSSFV